MMKSCHLQEHPFYVYYIWTHIHMTTLFINFYLALIPKWLFVTYFMIEAILGVEDLVKDDADTFSSSRTDILTNENIYIIFII